MKYLIMHENSVEKAKQISAKIWNMRVPVTADNITKYYTSWIEHPTDGRVALRVLGEASSEVAGGETVWSFTDSMPVHPDADPDALVTAVGDAVTAQERDNMKAKLAASKGGSASLLSFAMSTPSLSQRLKSHEEMEAEGWFPNPLS